MLDVTERERRAVEAGRAAVELAASDVAVIALTRVDTSGITRVKAIPTSRLEHASIVDVGPG